MKIRPPRNNLLICKTYLRNVFYYEEMTGEIHGFDVNSMLKMCTRIDCFAFAKPLIISTAALIQTEP